MNNLALWGSSVSSSSSLPSLLCVSGWLTNVSQAKKSEDALPAPELLPQQGPPRNSHPGISRPGALDAVECWELTLLFPPHPPGEVCLGTCPVWVPRAGLCSPCSSSGSLGSGSTPLWARRRLGMHSGWWNEVSILNEP